jgi:hypothetical protein
MPEECRKNAGRMPEGFQENSEKFREMDFARLSRGKQHSPPRYPTLP